MAGDPVITDIFYSPGDIQPTRHQAQVALLLVGGNAVRDAGNFVRLKVVGAPMDAGAAGCISIVPLFRVGAGGYYDSVDGDSTAEQTEIIISRLMLGCIRADLAGHVSFQSDWCVI